MLTSMFVFALVAGGITGLPPRFEVECAGQERAAPAYALVPWSINLEIDLVAEKFSENKGASWSPIAWIGDDKTAMFLRLGDTAYVQEILDLRQGTLNYIDSEKSNKGSSAFVGHGKCRLVYPSCPCR